MQHFYIFLYIYIYVTCLIKINTIFIITLETLIFKNDCNLSRRNSQFPHAFDDKI